MSSELTTTDLNFPTDGNINANGNITITNSTSTTYTWPTVDATPNQVLSAGSVLGTMEWIDPSTTPPGGVNGSVQFNNTTFDGETTFLWDTTNNRLLVAPTTLINNTPIPLPTPDFFLLDIRNDFNASASTAISLMSGTSGNCAINMSSSTVGVAAQFAYIAGSSLLNINSDGSIIFSATGDLEFNSDTGVIIGSNTGSILTTLNNTNITSTSGDITLSSSNNCTIQSTGNCTIGYTGALGSLLLETDTITYTWPTTTPLAGQFLSSDASGNLSWTTPAAVGSLPAGSDGSIQFNTSGAFDGNSNFVYDDFTTNSRRLLVVSPGSTTAPIYTTASQFTLDLRNDVNTTDNVVINLQSGVDSTDSGIRYSDAGTPLDTYIRYDYITSFPDSELNINTQGALNINSTQNTTITSTLNNITLSSQTFNINTTSDINMTTTLGLVRLVGNSSVELRGDLINFVTGGGTQTYVFGTNNVIDEGILFLEESSPNVFDVVTSSNLRFDTTGTYNRFIISGGLNPDPPSGVASIASVDIASGTSSGDSAQLRLFAETNSTDSSIIFSDDLTAPISPEAIIGYNHNVDTFSITLPNNGDIMNFTNTNGSEINISVPNGNLTIETSTQSMTFPTNANVNRHTLGAFLRISTDISPSPTDLRLEWSDGSNATIPGIVQTSYTSGSITHRGYSIFQQDPILRLTAQPTNPNDDSSIVIAMEADTGDVLEIVHFRDTLNFEHTLSTSMPVYSNPNVVMEYMSTDLNNTLTWTYDEVLNMQIDRSGANDIYNWTWGPTGTPVMTISRDTGTNITTYSMDDLIDMSVNSGTGTYSWTFGPGGSPAMTMTTTGGTSAFTMDIDATGSGDFLVYNAGNILRFTSLSQYKDNQRPLDFDSSIIYQLQPKSFEWNTKGCEGKTDFGYIAEEVEQVNKVFAHYNGKNGELSGVKYSQLVVPIIEELKKINQRIETLNTKLHEVSNM